MNFLNILMMPVQIYIYYLPPCGDDHSIRESSWFYTVGTGRRLPPHPHHTCQTTTTRWSKTGDELMLWITDSFSLLLFRDYYSTCNDMTSILLIHPVSCWWSSPQFVAMTFRIHSPSVSHSVLWSICIHTLSEVLHLIFCSLNRQASHHLLSCSPVDDEQQPPFKRTRGVRHTPLMRITNCQKYGTIQLQRE